MPQPKKPTELPFDPADYEYDQVTDRFKNGKSHEELTWEELQFVKALDEMRQEEETEAQEAEFRKSTSPAIFQIQRRPS